MSSYSLMLTFHSHIYIVLGQAPPARHHPTVEIMSASVQLLSKLKRRQRPNSITVEKENVHPFITGFTHCHLLHRNGNTSIHSFILGRAELCVLCNAICTPSTLLAFFSPFDHFIACPSVTVSSQDVFVGWEAGRSGEPESVGSRMFSSDTHSFHAK